jgi:hypothetical protein
MNGTQMEAPAKVRAQAETFSATLNRLQEQQAAKVDVVLGTKSDVRFVLPVEDGIARPRIAFGEKVPNIGGMEFNVLDHAHRQMADRVRVPWNFYDRLRNDHPDVLVTTMNTLWDREPDSHLVRTLNNGVRDVRAWLSDRYRVIDNLPFLLTALEEAEKHGAQVATANVDETRLYVKLLTQRVQVMNLGDPIQAGVIIRNSEVGDGKIEVAPFTINQACWNGAVSTKNYSRIHLGGILDDGIQSAETQLKESDAIFSAIRDWVRYALAPENLAEIVAAFERAEANRIRELAPPKLAVANVVRFAGLNRADADSVFERYLRADRDTQFSLAGAVTEQAHQGSYTYRKQVDLEEAGGKLSEMTPAEFNRLITRPLSDKDLVATYSKN